jgi:WD40 repeat protein
VAFSPNGMHVVSSSRNCTIRIWDAGTDDLVAGLFKGQTYAVFSIAFLTDGTHVVSGS